MAEIARLYYLSGFKPEAVTLSQVPTGEVTLQIGYVKTSEPDHPFADDPDAFVIVVTDES